MNSVLNDVLQNRPANYLLPFYWQHGNHYERIVEQMDRIESTGARALCVESRPHEDFGGETWWRDMDLILSEAARRGLKVWLLDDNHFPTGNCNGLLKDKYPQLRRWHLMEKHVDVLGPLADASLLLPKVGGEDELARVCAYRRTGSGEELEGEAVELTGQVRDGFLFWDIPEGCWRVFFVYKTRRGSLQGQEFYIDMLNPASVHVLIEAVYEPHYERYRQYFGNTFAGFFSDEPNFGNDRVGSSLVDYGEYTRKVGQPGIALPWSEDVLDRMNETLGYDAADALPLLWYADEARAPEVRYAYMDAVSALYRDCFTRQIGDWCRAHNVEYIGHIIEDMNAHARLGRGVGHFFRSLDGQDMSGIDIVLHQVMPGMAHYDSAFLCWGGVNDAEFFHYVLGKLGSSMAHLNPLTRGRAMCEVFGAYGWAEGGPMMRWLMDYLLVRGVNHFVPHAFSPDFPDPDCPPHFGAEGHDPQFEAFVELMGYTNRAAHLLYGGRHVANAAILYHAEAEWMNGECMLTQKPARELYDRQIDYDILPADSLYSDAAVRDGKLCVQDERYDCLIVPYAALLPEKLLAALYTLHTQGAEVWFVDALPENCPFDGKVAPLETLAEDMRARGFAEVLPDRDFPLLRVYHVERDGMSVFMLANESVTETAALNLRLPRGGRYLRLDLLTGETTRGESADGTVPVCLPPYQSAFYVFDDFSDAEFGAYPSPAVWKPAGALQPTFEVSIAPMEKLDEFQPYCTADTLFNMTGPDHRPAFSGKMRYRAVVTLPAGKALRLDLGRVGQTAKAWLNGRPLGQRICPPYAFVLEGVRDGENELVVEVSNTLGNAVQDPFSCFVTLPPSGLLGPLTLWERE